MNKTKTLGFILATSTLCVIGSSLSAQTNVEYDRGDLRTIEALASSSGGKITSADIRELDPVASGTLDIVENFTGKRSSVTLTYSKTLTGRPGSVYQYRAQATDDAGQNSGFQTRTITIQDNAATGRFMNMPSTITEGESYTIRIEADGNGDGDITYIQLFENYIPVSGPQLGWQQVALTSSNTSDLVGNLESSANGVAAVSPGTDNLLGATVQLYNERRGTVQYRLTYYELVPDLTSTATNTRQETSAVLNIGRADRDAVVRAQTLPKPGYEGWYAPSEEVMLNVQVYTDWAAVDAAP